MGAVGEHSINSTGYSGRLSPTSSHHRCIRQSTAIHHYIDKTTESRSSCYSQHSLPQQCCISYQPTVGTIATPTYTRHNRQHIGTAHAATIHYSMTQYVIIGTSCQHPFTVNEHVRPAMHTATLSYSTAPTPNSSQTTCIILIIISIHDMIYNVFNTQHSRRRPDILQNRRPYQRPVSPLFVGQYTYQPTLQIKTIPMMLQMFDGITHYSNHGEIVASSGSAERRIVAHQFHHLYTSHVTLAPTHYQPSAMHSLIMLI
jgi:hypothetical protein